jgi:hypothetical protein
MGTLLQRLDFGASHVYSRRGRQSGSRESQQRVRDLWRGDTRTAVVGGLWVPMIIAQKLRKNGLAREVAPIIVRARAAREVCLVPAEMRPDVKIHRDSSRAEIVKPSPTKIVLLNDVVTQGCTVLGRRSFGRIAIANADAGAGAFGNVAIDEAERAVQESLASGGLV